MGGPYDQENRRTSEMANPTAAMLVIGDEILSGRTRDANMYHLAGQLTEAAIDLKEVRVVSDDHDGIVAAVRALSGAYDHVFTSGGIGPTHDDITADAVAAAFSEPIDIREDARAILATNYENGEYDLNEARLRMARVPDSATLIDNPISKAPGFTLKNVHVMAGVPKIFEAMLASLLPNLTGGEPLISETIRVDRPEGDIAGPLGEIAGRFGDVSLGSYPFSGPTGLGANIVVRSANSDLVEEVAAAVRAAFEVA